MVNLDKFSSGLASGFNTGSAIAGRRAARELGQEKLKLSRQRLGQQASQFNQQQKLREAENQRQEAAATRDKARLNIAKGAAIAGAIEKLIPMDAAVVSVIGDNILTKAGLSKDQAKKFTALIKNPSDEAKLALGKMLDKVKVGAKTAGRETDPLVAQMLASDETARGLSLDFSGTMLKIDAFQKKRAQTREAITKAQESRQALEFKNKFRQSLSLQSQPGIGPKQGSPERGQLNKSKALFAIGKEKEAVEAMFEPTPLSPFEKEFQKKEAGKLSDQGVVARDAFSSLQGNEEARAMLRGPLISGVFGAEAVLEIGKALSVLGFTEFDDPVRNTQAFFATRAKETARIIKAFGAGTGLSDADREYAAAAAAGSITLTKEAIVRITNINERLNRAVIRRWNSRVSGIARGKGQPALTIDLPAPSIEIMDRGELTKLQGTLQDMTPTDLARAGRRHRELLEVSKGRREILGR